MTSQLFGDPSPVIDLVDGARVAVTFASIVILGFLLARALRIADYRHWAMWALLAWAPSIIAIETSQFGHAIGYFDLLNTAGLVCIVAYLVGARPDGE